MILPCQNVSDVVLVFFLRHFPTEYDVQLAGQIEEQAETLPVEVLGQAAC